MILKANRTLKYFTPTTDNFNRYVNDIKSISLIPINESLIELAKKNDKNAIKKIIFENQGIVIQNAKKMANGNHDIIMDLISEGNIGLLEAIKRFDTSKQNKFLTYAAFYVRKNMDDFMTNKNQIKKKSLDAYSKSKNIINEFFLKNGRTPEIEELKEILLEKHNITITDETQLYEIITNSIDNTIGDTEEKTSLYEKVCYDKYNEGLDDYESEHNKFIIKQALSKINERDAEIIKKIYGIDRYFPETMDDVADEYGLSKNAVLAIKNKTLEKLKNEVLLSHN